MNRQKLMILGAGQYQVPIINRAQQMGFETIAVSTAGDYPGFAVADRSYQVDVRAKEEILELAKQEGICGVLTDQTDIPVPTVAFVAEKMGLPGIGYDCARLFTNKYEMRRLCDRLGVPVPKHGQASSLPEARELLEQLDFPLVVKPVDSQGKRGVSKVNHPAELELKFQNAMANSFCGRAILEEFFTGVEVSVEGFLSESRLTNLMIGDRYSFPFPDLFEPDQGMYPSLLGQELKKKTLEVNAHFYENTGATFGITHAEYLVNEKTGAVCLAEGSIRGGGVYISSDMIPWVCGVDVNGPLIELATGKRASFRIDETKAHERAAGYVCFYLPEGIIRRVDGIERVRALPGVHRLSLPELDSGTRTGRVGRDTIKQRAVVVIGEDRQACRETVRRIQENLVVEVDTPTGVKGIQWGTPK